MVNEEDFSDEEERKVKIVRAVLLFATLVIVAVAVYTTVQIFGNVESISFSPPSEDNIASVNLGNNDPNSGVPFNVKQKIPDQNGEDKTYETQQIQPSPANEEENFKPQAITPLVIYDEEQFKKDRLVWVLILVEVFVIFAIYRKVDGYWTKKVKN